MGQKITVIGGGAAGLMAAIQAARRGANVTILERGKKNGRKLLATGNGRCNFTNLHMDADCYHSQDIKFIQRVLELFTVKDTLDFFTGIGLYPKNRDGYLYPYSDQAASVLELLMMEAAFHKVKVKTNCMVERLEYSNDVWRIHTEGWTYEADKVILASGSFASNIAEADGSGYQLAKLLGYDLIEPLPALVPLVCSGNPGLCKKWSGVRMEGGVVLYVDGIAADRSRGELQMTDYGISGIPVFQISGTAVRALYDHKKVELELDLMPGMSLEQLEELLVKRRTDSPYKNDRELLTGLLPDKLADALGAERIGSKLKHLRLTVTGSKPAEFAQVCSGGIMLCQLNPETMESRIHPGLYFAGEILDADGICGGYNLQWAWSSGALAGIHAAGERKYD